MPNDNSEARHISPVGLWTWDVQRDLAFTDEVACQYFNVTAREGHEGRPLNRLLDAIHPEDLPRVDRSIKDALGGTPYRVRYRVLSRQLGERSLLASGRCFFDPGGQPTFYPGFVIDVSGLVGTAIERLSGQLTVSRELASKIGDPAISYLLEAAQFEVDELLSKGGIRLN